MMMSYWGPMTLMTIYIWRRSFYALVKNAIPGILQFLGSCNFYRRHIPTFT